MTDVRLLVFNCVYNFLNKKRYSSSLFAIVFQMSCRHWACNVSDGTCVGCGIRICPLCLKEPDSCRCENKHECCKDQISQLVIFNSCSNSFRTEAFLCFYIFPMVGYLSSKKIVIKSAMCNKKSYFVIRHFFLLCSDMLR